MRGEGLNLVPGEASRMEKRTGPNISLGQPGEADRKAVLTLYLYFTGSELNC